VDLNFIQPVHSPNVEFKYLTGDFTSKAILNTMMNQLNGKYVDLVLSDMAPNTTGIRELDHSRIIELVNVAYNFAQKVLKKNGTFFFKSFAGGEEVAFKSKLKEKFDKVLPIKPASSRDHSSELYFLCLGFKRDYPIDPPPIDNKSIEK
jgi:23S rRNA (uridine2552-2'-O)-methyltransferase